MLERLQKRNADIQEIFRILLKTNTGKFLYDLFIKEYLKKKIKFCHYPNDLIEKLNKLSIVSAEPNGACFVTDGIHSTIYYDPNCEAIVLAIYFIHEITHSLDETLWNLALRPADFSYEETQKIKNESEYSSFRNQFRFLTEIEKINPGTIEYLEKNYPVMKILNAKFNDENKIKIHYEFKIAS